MTEEEFDEPPTGVAIAYRMPGSVSEAEDMVQEGFLRLHRARASGTVSSVRAMATRRRRPSDPAAAPLPA